MLEGGVDPAETNVVGIDIEAWVMTLLSRHGWVVIVGQLTVGVFLSQPFPMLTPPGLLE